MTKQEYIGNYLDRRMKNHGLPYGTAYINLLATMEEKAVKAWKQFKNKQNGLRRNKGV